jgi:hypothetical protein
MQSLNFPAYTFKTKSGVQRKQIFDPIRKKYVALTPEEWVRQHLVQFLIQERNFPASLIAIEMGMKLNGMQKRGDVVAYNNLGKPFFIAECKAPEVKITQDVFDQVARYNIVLQVPYLLVSNGLQHFCCEVNLQTEQIQYLKEIPNYKELTFSG